jgi:two-component system, OmpR family, response regulator
MRMLVVEDDQKIASFVTKGLQQAGYAVDHADNGEDGLHLGLHQEYDAAVVDLMLPKIEGLSMIERWREAGMRTPVIILSAKHGVDDRIEGLQRGGDDYVTKPFSFAELLARVQALIRRSSQVIESSELKIANLRLDLISRTAWRDASKIELQAREFGLLEYLLRNAGRVVSKTMILEHVWDYSFDPQTNVVDVLVCRLRNKIDRDFEPKLIHTLRGQGYVVRTEP